MKPLFSFGIISDCQYADIPDYHEYGPRLFRRSKDKLQQAIDFFNESDLEFVVHLGDLIDQNPDNFDVVLPICAQSKAPFWQVLGNHDFKDKDYTQADPSLVMKKLGLKKAYYSRIVKNYRFIILDTNEEGIIKGAKSSPEYKQGQKILEHYKKLGRVNAMPWNGRINNTQHRWLIKEIEAAEQKNQRVIIFSHHGLYPKHRENMLNDQEMVAELSAIPSVKAYINGHNHFGDYGVFEGLPCLTVKGMLDTEENSYSVAHVYDDKIVIEGYGREHNRIMAIKNET